MNASPKVLSDFPDWLGPMLVKELRQGLKARAFVTTFVGLQIVLVLVTIYHAILYGRNPATFDGNGLGALFWALIAVQLLLVTPVRALGALANERKANTLELIYMTGLTPWRIAWGKWASLMFQALLFLMAVLPYAILRYFFGSMNLAEEMLSLGLALLMCALFTAVSLGISGLALPFRVIFFCLAAFLGMSLLPMLLFGAVMRGGSSGPFPDLLGMGYGWLLIIFDAVVIVAGAIEVAAATISPPAGTSTMRLRILSLLLWVPIPILYFFEAPEDAIVPQVIIACCAAALLCWQNLAAPSEIMRPHVEPFSFAGRLAPIVGGLFLPGWPSAVLFLVFTAALAVASFIFIPNVPGTQIRWLEPTALIFMSGAALMTPPLIWQIIRRTPKWPLVEHTVVLSLSGVLYSFQDAMELGLSQTGGLVWLALYPPIGLWALVDDGLSSTINAWWSVSLFAFAATATGLLLFSKSYWRRVGQLSREMRTPDDIPAVSLSVVA